MTSYLVEIYGESKDFEETEIIKGSVTVSSCVLKQRSNSYEVYVEVTADNPDTEINYQLWDGFFKNKRWFRVHKLNERDEVVAWLNLLTDKFEKTCRLKKEI